jgi:hypothetical protein
LASSEETKKEKKKKEKVKKDKVVADTVVLEANTCNDAPEGGPSSANAVATTPLDKKRENSSLGNDIHNEAPLFTYPLAGAAGKKALHLLLT